MANHFPLAFSCHPVPRFVNSNSLGRPQNPDPDTISCTARSSRLWKGDRYYALPSSNSVIEGQTYESVWVDELSKGHIFLDYNSQFSNGESGLLYGYGGVLTDSGLGGSFGD